MNKVPFLLKISSVIAALVLAGCASNDANYAQGPMLSGPSITAPTMPTADPNQPSPADKIAMAASSTADVSPYIDSTAVAQMSTVDRTQASNAQYYALQFGRPGAARNWAGDSGATGSVVVGPFVTVNSLDCRDFTHTVKISGTSYVRQGTACREASGNWSVIKSNSASG